MQNNKKPSFRFVRKMYRKRQKKEGDHESCTGLHVHYPLPKEKKGYLKELKLKMNNKSQ